MIQHLKCKPPFEEKFSVANFSQLGSAILSVPIFPFSGTVMKMNKFLLIQYLNNISSVDLPDLLEPYVVGSASGSTGSESSGEGSETEIALHASAAVAPKKD